VLPSVSVTVVFKTAVLFAVLRFSETFSSSSKAVSTRLHSQDKKGKHGKTGINVSQMEVNENTARRVSHGAADNYSSIMRCYATTSGNKVTYLSANIYQSKKHNILEDLNLPRTP
jgi:hypothetical protein